MNTTASIAATKQQSEGVCEIQAMTKLSSEKPIAHNQSAAIAVEVIESVIKDCLKTEVPSLSIHMSNPVLAKQIGFNPQTMTVTTQITLQPSENKDFTSDEATGIAAFMKAPQSDLPKDIQQRLRSAKRSEQAAIAL